MANHDQQPNRRLMTCANCQAENCDRCIDVIRSVYSDENICTCMRRDHQVTRDTEILNKQLANIVWGGDQSPC